MLTHREIWPALAKHLQNPQLLVGILPVLLPLLYGERSKSIRKQGSDCVPAPCFNNGRGCPCQPPRRSEEELS